MSRMPRMRTTGRGFAASCGALALAASVLACSPVPQPPAAQPTPAESSPPPTTSVDVPIVSSEVPAARDVVAPVRVLAPAIGVEMPVIPVGIDGSDQMELPEDPAVAGWYRYGPDAAATAGHIVISAHIDSPQYPIGPLARLQELSPGAEVAIADAGGTMRSFRIESVQHFDKTELPVDEIFRRDGAPALVLITCGGPFDSSTGRYRDNVVAVASPL